MWYIIPSAGLNKVRNIWIQVNALGISLSKHFTSWATLPVTHMVEDQFLSPLLTRLGND